MVQVSSFCLTRAVRMGLRGRICAFCSNALSKQFWTPTSLRRPLAISPCPSLIGCRRRTNMPAIPACCQESVANGCHNYPFRPHSCRFQTIGNRHAKTCKRGRKHWSLLVFVGHFLCKTGGVCIVSRGRSPHSPGLVGDDVRSPAHASSRRRLQPSALPGSRGRSPHQVHGSGNRSDRNHGLPKHQLVGG